MEKNILGYKCKKCGHVHYPYRTLCRNCSHNAFETVPLPRTGKLLTFTHVHTLPPDYEVAKLSLGIVELENGNRILGQLKIENPKIGMKVRGKVEVVRRDDYNKYQGMVFYKI
jgi:uncharacterized OB-fold protein